MRNLRPPPLAIASLACCLAMACGGKTVETEPPGGSSGSGSSSGGSSGGSSSSGATSSSGGSSGGVETCVSLDLSTYDRSCLKASDCIQVLSGEVCSGYCDCPQAVVSSSQLTRYDQAISSIEFGQCGCPAESEPLQPQCVDQLCTLGSTSVDGGQVDAGICVDVDISTYDTSCKVDSDCIDITAGVVCTGQCDCGGATINVDGEARYDAALAPVERVDCPCISDGVLRCVQSQCTRCPIGPNDSPGCSDDGG